MEKPPERLVAALVDGLPNDDETALGPRLL